MFEWVLSLFRRNSSKQRKIEKKNQVSISGFSECVPEVAVYRQQIHKQIIEYSDRYLKVNKSLRDDVLRIKAPDFTEVYLLFLRIACGRYTKIKQNASHISYVLQLSAKYNLVLNDVLGGNKGINAMLTLEEIKTGNKLMKIYFVQS